MADWETFNFGDIRKKVPVTVLADSMRAIAEWLEAEGRTDVAARFSKAAGVSIAPLVVAPEILAAACQFCRDQGEPAMADRLRERFMIRG